MYIPEIFKEEDKKEIDAIIDRNSLAVMVAVTENGLTAHHLPLLREAEDSLCGHIALANDLHRHLKDGAEFWQSFAGRRPISLPTGIPARQNITAMCPPGIIRRCTWPGLFIF